MAKKQKGGSVPPTLKPKEEPQQEEVTVNAPIEIFFHIAGANVVRYDTPNGASIHLSLISPTGIAATVVLNEDNVKQLIENLTKTISTVDVFTSLPSGLKA